MKISDTTRNNVKKKKKKVHAISVDLKDFEETAKGLFIFKNRPLPVYDLVSAQ